MSCGVGRRCGSDPELLWLWRRLAAIALIQPLAWEPPYAVAAAQEMAKKDQKKKKRKRKKKEIKFYSSRALGSVILFNFFWPGPWHVEAPRSGIKPMPTAVTRATAVTTPDP